MVAPTVTSYVSNTGVENISSFTGFITTANASGGGALFAGIDVLVFFVLFLSLASGFGWEVALFSSGFITLILSILFLYMGVVSTTFVGWFVGIIIALIMYVIWSNRYD